MSGNSKTIIAFNYFWGKFTFLNYLYQCFPASFTHLVELFGGSSAISLNYKGRCIKTVNEINTDITNFFEVLRDHESELTKLLLLTPCSNEEYNQMKKFSDFQVKITNKGFIGDKVKPSEILNLPIIIHDYKIVDSKFSGQQIHLQIEFKNTMHLMFTTGVDLRQALLQIPEDGFPFETTIIKTNGRYRFT